VSIPKAHISVKTHAIDPANASFKPSHFESIALYEQYAKLPVQMLNIEILQNL